MEIALTLLEQIKPLSPEHRGHLIKVLKERAYRKREFLLREDETCRQMWFIEKGIVGCFYEKSERSLCSWFMKEGDICTSVTSYFSQIKSAEDIIALDETLTWYITKVDLDLIYEKFPEFNLHGRLLTERYYMASEERMRAFHNQPPLQKYQYLMTSHPSIVQRVSVKDMARYIGMHPDALSRVRGKM